MKRFNVVLVLILLFGTTVRPQTPQPLGADDFAGAGIVDQMTPESVQKLLGKPLSIRSYPHPFDPDTRTIQWRYRGLNLAFNGGSVHGIYLNTAKYATSRGLRVGDPLDKLIRLYGKPTGTYETGWDYQAPENELHVIRVTIKKKRVSEIYVGWLTD